MERRIIAGAVSMVFVSEAVALPCYYRIDLPRNLSECALFVPQLTGPACHDALPHSDERERSTGQFRGDATVVSSSSTGGAYQTTLGAFQAGAFQGN